MRVQHAWLSARKWGSIPTGSAGSWPQLCTGNNPWCLPISQFAVFTATLKSSWWTGRDFYRATPPEVYWGEVTSLKTTSPTQSDGVTAAFWSPKPKAQVQILVALPQIVDRLAVSVV